MRLLLRLGLNRPELRAWALYDWANSVFMTTVLQIFPLFFTRFAAATLPENVARSRFAFVTSAAVVLVGLLGPILGALADFHGNKKRWLAFFLGLGVLTTAGMYFIGRGDWKLALWLFAAANVGITSTLAFYNSLLPHIAAPDEVDRVSTAGFALGYLGGGILLAVNLLMIQSPQRFGLAGEAAATRVAFLSAALWWLVFSIPLFVVVKEPARAQLATADEGNPLVVALARLRRTVQELGDHRDGVLLLLAFFIYNDAINTIIRMATTFGDELHIPPPALIAAVLMVQFVGVPFAFLFGALAHRFGAKKAVLVALLIYGMITVYGFWLRTTRQFFVMAFLVATVMGGAQALSRSLFSTLIPKHKSSEMFGFFGTFDRFGGAMGSFIFGLVVASTGSSGPAILSLLAFFVIGGVLLAFVDVERGRRAAEKAETGASGGSPGGMR